jgi:hypothetical protein
MAVALSTITNALVDIGALSDALANLFKGRSLPSLSSYASVTSIPVTYSNATTTKNATITGDSLHSITFTCVMTPQGGCVFLPQNKIHSVFINDETRRPEIVAGARRKPSSDSPNVELYPSLDAAMLACKPQGSQIDPSTLPNSHQFNSTTPGTPGTPGNIRPPGTILPPPSTILPPPSNGTTSPPLPYIWEGDYITITKDSNSSSKWSDGAFNPIIVDLTNSTSVSLTYIKIEFSGGEELWSVLIDLINKDLPRYRKAFGNIKEAVAFLSQLHLPPPGGGKRTRKDKKNKTGNRKNHQSLRMRKRRVHVY